MLAGFWDADEISLLIIIRTGVSVRLSPAKVAKSARTLLAQSPETTDFTSILQPVGPVWLGFGYRRATVAGQDPEFVQFARWLWLARFIRLRYYPAT